MMRYFRDILALAFLISFPLTAAKAEDRNDMALALSAAEAKDWVTARDSAQRSGPMAEALIGWQALRAGYGEFHDYLAFIRMYPDWPGLALLREKGDKTLHAGLPADDIREWFGERRPDSLNAEVAYLSALTAGEAKPELARFWVETQMTAAEETAFLDKYGSQVASLNYERATRMLDQQEWQQAERLLPKIEESERPLLKARIALQARRTGVDDLILALPEKQRNDPGLTMDRFLWRVAAKLHDGAQELMLDSSTSAEALRDPEVWAQMRVDYSRLAMRNGDWRRALQLAAPHFLTPENRHYSDLEWLAGYAALKTNDPKLALKHFEHLETVVGSAISQARAYYWQGRAYEAMGQNHFAREAYQKGAQFPGVFYGQLSAEKTGKQMPAEFAVTGKGIETLPDWRGTDLRESSVFRAALWLIAVGRLDEAQRFLLHLSETSEPKDIARMARLMIEAGAPWHGLRLSKRAADHGEIYPAAHFPLTGLEKSDLGLPPELVLSIARQESEFNHTVSSYVGAQGLMQLMPGTAKQMARKIGEPYRPELLTTEPAYNARLGAAYLSGLRDRFGTSTALTASGYNAGPGRPIQWLRDFGDLRRDVDPVDWVELIPFDETRNYVMRVTEAMPIYRARIQGEPAPMLPTWDLSGGGLMPPPELHLTLAMSLLPPDRPVIGPHLPKIGPQLPRGWIKPTSRAVATK